MAAYFDRPGYNCGNCRQLYQEEQHKPDCLRPRGCQIGEDIALDRDVNTFVNAFILTKRRPDAEHHKKLYMKILEKHGYTDDVEFLAAVERVYLAQESERQHVEQMMRQGRR